MVVRAEHIGTTPSPVRFKRPKDYPRVIANTLITGVNVAVTLAALHAAPDVLQHFSVGSVPFFGGLTQGAAIGADWIGSHLSDLVAGVTTHIVPQASVGPDTFLHNNLVQSALSKIPNNTTYFRANDLITGEAAAGLSLGSGLIRTAWTATAKRHKQIGEPNSTTMHAAQDVIDAVRKKGNNPLHRIASPRRWFKDFSHLDQTAVAAEIAGVAGELKQAKIQALRPYAPAFAWVFGLPFIREVITPKSATNFTLRKEIFHRLPNHNPIHAVTLGLTDHWTVNLAERIPGAGNIINAIDDGIELVFGLIPKRDVFGKWHNNFGNLGINGLAFVLGELVGDNLPFANSGDFKEAMEVHARPALQGTSEDPRMNAYAATQVDAAAKAIAAGRILERPRAFNRARRA